MSGLTRCGAQWPQRPRAVTAGGAFLHCPSCWPGLTCALCPWEESEDHADSQCPSGTGRMPHVLRGAGQESGTCTALLSSEDPPLICGLRLQHIRVNRSSLPTFSVTSVTLETEASVTSVASGNSTSLTAVPVSRADPWYFLSSPGSPLVFSILSWLTRTGSPHSTVRLVSNTQSELWGDNTSHGP